MKEMKVYGVEVLVCKWCPDHIGIIPQLEARGITSVYVGSVISKLIKDGWAQLTF